MSASESASVVDQAQAVRPTEVFNLPVPGLRYIRDFLTPEGESALLAAIDAHPWDGVSGRRIQQYGFMFTFSEALKYYDVTRLELAPGFPKFLNEISDQVLTANYAVARPDQCLVNEYMPGQGIYPHVDNPQLYEDNIIGISLGSAAIMDFTHEQTGEKTSWLLEPRSLMIFTGDCRFAWAHSIAERTEDEWNGATIKRDRRVSITIRKTIPAVVDVVLAASATSK